MTAAEKILQKALVTSDIGSEQWNSIQAGLRDRAFFSARVAEVRFLDAMRSRIAESLSGNLSQSEFRKAVREMLTHGSYDAGENRGTIKDLMTKARLDLIFDTNRKMAQGYVQHLQATTDGALAAFPAYELLRAEPRKMPRNWPAIWQQKGGTLYQGRMIAPKTDPIWTRISRFGLPYPPFDYNSGMDIFSVSRSECLALGVPLPEPGSANGASAPSFNGNLQAELPIADNSPEADRLREAFGDQIRFDGNVAHWRGELIQEVLSGKVRRAKLGRGYDGRILSISHNIFKDHLHIHVGAEEHDRRNIPLTKGDFELLPAMWRKPDKVSPAKHGRSHLEFNTFDGGVLNLIVDPDIGIVSFYKTKIPGGA
ncbi:MAG: hypothetical protein II823_07110 [Kiritimatiellae bacterium]|nr:hypothetical protein [Kiritimatiellia bacterium]